MTIVVDHVYPFLLKDVGYGADLTGRMNTILWVHAG